LDPVGSEVEHGRPNERTPVDVPGESKTLELPGLVMKILRRMDI